MDTKQQKIKIPKQFWTDLQWARKKHTKLLKDFRNQWVVVVNKKIISAGDNLEKVENKAKKLTKKKLVATLFVDGGEHIYAC